MMNWTRMFVLKAFAVGAIALAIPFARADLYQEQLGWALVATYVLTGIIFLMFGMLLDAHKSLQRPQEVEVLLRHEGKAWLFTVLRNRTGEIYAPADGEMRNLRPIDPSEVAHTTLRCPKFIQSKDAPDQYMILGQVYTYEAA